MKTKKFKEITIGTVFVQNGITYKKLNNGQALTREIFGKRSVYFNQNEKIKVKK